MKATLAIPLVLLTTNLMAYNLTMRPLNDKLTVGFTPGASAATGQPGQTRTDKNHNINDFTQLRVKSSRYHALNNIGALSVDQKSATATVKCQPAAWSEKYTIQVFYNGVSIGQCVSDGAGYVNINNFNNNGNIRLDVKEGGHAK